MKFLVIPSQNASNYLKTAQRFAYGFLGGIILASMIFVFVYMQSNIKVEDQLLVKENSEVLLER
ncbi:MAG: hypothetical protein MRZ79_08900 [Bacteroidia bacterium]|nr:hypothetical protein [Bacteroidia bacterium]